MGVHQANGVTLWCGLIKSPVSVADLELEPEPEDPAPPPPPPEEKKGFWDSLLDGVQLALDVVGMIPGVGEIADLANAGISLARGDYAGAALSLAACVPFAGWAATGTKFVKKGMNAFETGQKIVKAADKVIDTTKTAMNAIGAVVGKVYTSARNVIANGIDKVANAVKLMKQQMKSTVMAAKKGLQKKIASIKKNVKQGLDNLRNKLPGPSKEFVTPEGIKVNFKEVKDQAHKIELPKTEVQQNYLKAMKEMEEEAAARAAKETGNGKASLEANPFDKTGKLKPDIRYKTGEYDYFYETDKMGRINKFETDNLQLTKREDRLGHDANTPGKQNGDHAGHLAGDRFGGSPELDNLVSQSSNVNLSKYKKIENQWAKALKNGKKVKTKVEVEYEGNSLRPSKFNVQYEIDGKYFEKSILN
ncbi:DNA/RNA non-specific endonuclease [Brevibacillus laterosporus]|uniref:DNA/RNA non-specific endonuclease n=1 Tax=Brevibacillus laterosporus TaxID=1465 RepID=UPI0021577840|nr:DNA/RNA non-specific endonuclease [Brevibacillus laterosporus]